jgi:hypothetical protein
MSESRVSVRIGTLAAAAFLLAASLASARTLNTAMNGLDSSSCGDPKTPCRSISQAIVNAQPNDTVLVGPGRYGDVNGDGALSGSGEEGQSAENCGCLVKIDKHITVKSRDGAAATVIDAAGLARNPVAFEPGSDGATLGGPQNGFTLRKSLIDGVFVDSAVTGAHILGNLAEENNGAGFQVLGSGVSLSGDRAVANGSGFVIRSSGALAMNDTATSNQNGFITIDGSLDCERCIASSNQFNGFLVQGGALTIRSSAALGNGAEGVSYQAGSSGQVTGSTLMGNGRVAPLHPCGVFNNSGTAVDATKNYWGAAGGPGASPADRSCGDAISSTISTTPFKTSELKVSPKPLK